MKKILTIVGARPQFIKAAAVSRAFRESKKFQELIVHTGQHFDSNMSDIFFDELDIQKPHYNLGVGGGGHGQNTGRMLESIETVIVEEDPDWVLVYGDTDSTLAGALAASKLHVPVVHIEAGLRSFNMNMPEEINRKITDHISDLLLTANENSITLLSKEGISGSHVVNIGDVMYDAAIIFGEKAEIESQILDNLGLEPKTYILATVHRKENTDKEERLRNIIDGFATALHPVILPLHPRTRNMLNTFGISIPANIKVIDPLGYLDMVMLEKNAELIVTDSGGVQKEAYFYGVPCLTLRDETEWTELVELGWNKLVSPSNDIKEFLSIKHHPGKTHPDIYGDGNAGAAIIQQLEKHSR